MLLEIPNPRGIYHSASIIKVRIIAMKIDFCITDMFAEKPLDGNRLATFIDFSKLDGRQMRKMARETNFSERHPSHRLR